MNKTKAKSKNKNKIIEDYDIDKEQKQEYLEEINNIIDEITISHHFKMDGKYYKCKILHIFGNYRNLKYYPNNMELLEETKIIGKKEDLYDYDTMESWCLQEIDVQNHISDLDTYLIILKDNVQTKDDLILNKVFTEYNDIYDTNLSIEDLFNYYIMSYLKENKNKNKNIKVIKNSQEIKNKHREFDDIYIIDRYILDDIFLNFKNGLETKLEKIRLEINNFYSRVLADSKFLCAMASEIVDHEGWTDSIPVISTFTEMDKKDPKNNNFFKDIELEKTRIKNKQKELTIKQERLKKEKELKEEKEKLKNEFEKEKLKHQELELIKKLTKKHNIKIVE